MNGLADEDKTIELKKEVGQWVVPDQAHYPADPEKISKFIEKLEKMETGLLVGQTQPSHERFEVSDKKFQRKVQFALASGEKDDSHGFYLGSSPRFRNVHIRRFGQDKVFTTDQIASFDVTMNSNDWLQKKLMDVRSEDVFAIEIQRGKEKLKFTKVEKAATKLPEASEDSVSSTPTKEFVWKMGNQEVNKSTFDSILRNLSSLRLNQVLGKEDKKEYGLKKPQLVVKISYQKDAGTKEKVISIGQKDEADYYVKMADSPYYVKVAQYQLKSILETKKQEFVETN